MQTSTHIPVLLNEVMRAMDLGSREIVVDATYGRGGHSKEILRLLPPQGKLFVIDRDLDAIQHARTSLKGDQRIEIIHSAFSNLREIFEERGLLGKVNAILFDFGVSSPQLDISERGFSFNKNGPLDMRMDRTKGVSAANWIEQTEEEEIVRVLKRFGEERFAKRIARSIKEALTEGQVSTTAQLSQLVSDAVPVKEKHKHPATRTFQAIRIAVNQELLEIESVLPQALEVLAPGGRIVVISFHSLEDRIVKRFFRDQSKGDPFPHDLPVTADMLKPQLRLVGKKDKANEDELSENPRARSAIMRAAEMVG